LGESSSSWSSRHARLLAGSDFEGSHFEDSRSGTVISSGQCSEAGRQLEQTEWLHEIVISPGIEAPDAVAYLVACGEHDHRCPDAGFAELPAQLESVVSGKHHVEDDRLVGILCRHPEAFRAGSRQVDCMALFFEAAFEEAGHPQFVLHDKHRHGGNGTP